MSLRCATVGFAKNEEPSLDELFGEPAVRLMMASDRVDEAHVRRVASKARKRLIASASTPASPRVHPRS
jgi:hypothetical protein